MTIRSFSGSARRLALLAALLPITAAHAALTPQPVSTQAAVSAQSAVVVKLGNATLEEYRHGNPAERTLIVRDVTTAQGSGATPQTKHRA